MPDPPRIDSPIQTLYAAQRFVHIRIIPAGRNRRWTTENLPVRSHLTQEPRNPHIIKCWKNLQTSRIRLVRCYIHDRREADLLLVVQTFCLLRLRLRLRQRRQEHSREDRNNRNHHQQFDQRKPTHSRTANGTGGEKLDAFHIRGFHLSIQEFHRLPQWTIPTHTYLKHTWWVHAPSSGSCVRRTAPLFAGTKFVMWASLKPHFLTKWSGPI